MFEALLEEVSAKVGNLHVKVTKAEHNELVKEFLPWLSMECEPLLGASRAVLGADLFEGSEIGLEYKHLAPDDEELMSLPVDIGCMYIRKRRDDRGLSVNVNIFRCNFVKHRREPASINVELDICGLAEKKAFEELYGNYRRPMQRLLDANRAEFSTSYCSDTIGKYKGNSPSKKIDEYLSDTEVDNCFSLSKNFVGSADSAGIIRVFLLFSAIYHSCRGYLATKKNPDLFEAHMTRLR